MFGCVGRIGCAIILLVLGAVGWHFRERWVPKVKQFITSETGIKVTEQREGFAIVWGHT